MSPAKVALGNAAFNSIVAQPPGRLLINSGGSSSFMWNDAGYPNWGYSQATVTANEAYCRAALKWLARKTTGMSIVIVTYDANPTAGPWQSHFRDFVVRSPSASGSQMYGSRGPWAYGGGVAGSVAVHVVTESLSTWVDGNWGGMNPYDYDAVLLHFSYRAAASVAVLDAYLANRGAIWTFMMANDGTSRWLPYGQDHDIPPHVYLTGGDLSSDYLTAPVSVPPMGGSFQYGVYTSPRLILATNTMGGNAAMYGATHFLWSAS